MAYQPLYATLTDENGTRSSHSLRKKVNWITFWLNSKIGEVLTLHSSFDEDNKKVYIDISIKPNENFVLRLNKETLKNIIVEELE